MNIGPSAIAAVIVFLGVLIFVHELGHFLAAKFFDIKVVKFSLGFGPALFSFVKGETTYQIALVPLGGFVRMAGDNPMEEVPLAERARAFLHAPLYQRALIALAGPAFNLVFPIICFFAYYVLGPTVLSPLVGQVELETPAERAGFESGDRVLSVDGKVTWSFDRMAELISSRPNEEVRVRVLREGAEKELRVTPMAVTREDDFGNPVQAGIIGVTRSQVGTRVGVDDPAQHRAAFTHLPEGTGFRTGDEILSVNGKAVVRSDELRHEIRAVAGSRARFAVARPRPQAAGALLYADGPELLTLEAQVPAGADGLAALGLAPSDTFLRAVVPGGAADRAGLRPGDRVVKVAGKPVAFFVSFTTMAERAKSEPLSVVVRRDGRELELTLVNDEVQKKHEVTGKERPFYDPGLGMGALPRAYQTLHWSSAADDVTEVARLDLWEALVASVRNTGKVIALTATGLFKLISREVSTDTVGGPLTLFRVAAQAAELGIFAYLQWLAFISVNLGLFNLLPIPIFDGGHLLLCLIEAIKRKPLSLRAREAASIIGLVIIIALLFLATSNDLLRPEDF